MMAAITDTAIERTKKPKAASTAPLRKYSSGLPPRRACCTPRSMTKMVASKSQVKTASDITVEVANITSDGHSNVTAASANAVCGAVCLI